MLDYDIVIAGAGPAGAAAAIQIANRDPELARRTVVIEKAVFPRPKLCGGGVTTHADALLDKLGVRIDVPSVPIDALRFVFKDQSFTFRWRNLFRVVHRDEFDTALAAHIRERGVTLHEGEALHVVERRDDGVIVRTDRDEYRTRILIGADGANSIVRRQLGLVRWDRISRLLEILTPVDPSRAPEFLEHTAVFDFSPLALGVQGYYWDFPSIKQQTAVMNRGLFDSRVRPERPRAPLLTVLEESLAHRQVEIDPGRLRGHPERWFDPAVKHSAPHILLAGDAAGTEPLFGEGISHALDFGMHAADAAIRAARTQDYSFRDYERKIAWGALGRRLRFKRAVAHVVYGGHGDWFYRTGWTIFRALFGP